MKKNILFIILFVFIFSGSIAVGADCSDGSCLIDQNFGSSNGGGQYDTNGGNPEDALTGGSTPQMVPDGKGGSRIETSQEAANRTQSANSQNDTNGYEVEGEDTKSTFEGTKIGETNLTSYCKNKSMSGLVTYDGGVCGEGGDGYTAVIDTANKTIGWIVGIALLIAAGVGFFAGLKYVASAADPGQRASAKKMLVNVAIGLFLIFAAWLIVEFILNTFADGGAGGGYSGINGKTK